MRRRYDEEGKEEKESGNDRDRDTSMNDNSRGGGSNSRKAVSEMKATGAFLHGKLDDDFKRYQRWLSYTRPRIVLGFDRVLSTEAPVMSRKLHGLSLAFSSLGGWSMPSQLLAEIDSGDFYVSVRLSLSLCHMASKTFFGSTWLGSPVVLGEGRHEDIPDFIDFDYSEIVYLVSRLTDPSCVGIIEVVVSKMQRGKNVTVSQHGCGWTILPLFTQPYPPDLSDGHELVPQLNSCLYTGSPRDLLVLRPGANLETELKEMKGCHLNYKLFSHRKLLRAFKYIPENAIMGRFEMIPGLAGKSVTPDDEARTRVLCCIGDTQKEPPANEKKNRAVLCLPASPRVVKPFTLRIIDWHLLMPNRALIESKIRTSVAKNLSGKEADQCQIVSRTLKIGIHNGHCLVGGDWVCDGLAEDAEDPDVLLSVSQEIDIPYYIPHTHVALVLVIEYEVGLPADTNPAYDAKRTLETTRRGDNVVTSITIGAAAYIPMTSAGTLDLSNNTKDGREEDKLDIELGMRTDELCGVLSPNPVFDWRGGMKSNDGGMTASMGGGGYTAAIEGGEDDEPVLGFDLHAFTPDRIKIEDGYSPSNADKEPVSEAISGGVNDSIDDMAISRRSVNKDGHHRDEGKEGGDSNNNNNYMSDEDSDIDNDKRRARVGGKRYQASRRPGQQLHHGRDDDQDSLMDSIVGGDSVASILRLDKEFYAGTSVGDGLASDIDAFRRGRGGYDEPLIPKDRNSLLGRSLQAKLGAGGFGAAVANANRPQTGFGGGERGGVLSHVPRGLPMEDDPVTVRPNGMQRAITSKAPGYHFPVYAEPGKSSSAHARDLSRGNRARLGRHGFSAGGHGYGHDMATAGGSSNSKGHHQRPHGQGRGGIEGGVDIELEATDALALNEISFLFAGYRHGHPGGHSSIESDTPVATRSHQHSPRSVYFTFQFFTCAPTRTEIHRLLPADLGEMNVLCRDEPHGRDEQPMLHRFSIDCSDSSPLESVEFAEYLARCSLQVDVWDADSLLLLGSSMLPLRRLLRQGQRGAKCALECDVIDPEFESSRGAAGGGGGGGVSSMTITDDGGPVSGAVVGSINIIAENIGIEGRRKSSAYSRHLLNGHEGAGEREGGENRRISAGVNPIDGLNWRALGVDKSSGGANARPSNRAKNVVRARPLSESTPELSRALQDQQRYSGGSGPSMRSLSSVRGNGGTHTLNYDDIMVLFKRFQGAGKGTLQYEGKLLTLLDVPSWRMSLRKLNDAISKAMRAGDDIDGLLGTYSDSYGAVSLPDLREFLGVLLTRYGVAHKKEELAVLANKFIPGGDSNNKSGANESNRDSVKVAEVMAFCRSEHERGQWVLVGKRLRTAVQKASLSGEDIEQNLAEKDTEGVGYITTRDLKTFLEALSKYGKLTLQDINAVCRYFARRPAEHEPVRDPVSLREVMAFLGKEYVGNLSVRLRDAMMYTHAGADGGGGKNNEEKVPRTVADVVKVFRRNSSSDTSRGGGGGSRAATIADIDSALSELGVFETLSHDQVRAVLNKAQAKAALKDNNNNSNNCSNFTFGTLLRHLGVDYTGDVIDEKEEGRLIKQGSPRRDELTPEFLLRQVIDHTTQHGIAVDEAFRHFDSDGNGSISSKEFVRAFEQLKIFNNIPKWQDQIPALVAKFDSSGDGDVQLREFFAFLGVKADYSPNIEQRMTKIFAVAMEDDTTMTFESIFENFDADGDGEMTIDELFDCLKQLGTFNEISKEDVQAMITKFSRSDSDTVSLSDFKIYFTQRVKSAQAERKERNNRRNIRHFIELLDAAQTKGLTPEKVFAHFDKDGNGSLTADELSLGLMNLPQFKAMTRESVENIVCVIADPASQTISVKAFVSFIKEHSKVAMQQPSTGSNKSSPRAVQSTEEATAVQKFIVLMDAARSKGLSPEKLFCHFDRDGNGSLSRSELSGGLRKLEQFKSLTRDDVEDILCDLDADRSGSVSLEEFKAFLNRAKGGSRSSSYGHGSGSAVDKFRKLMEVSSSKGLSAAKIFKHFDKDNSGSLTTSEFVSGLKNLPQFQVMTKSDYADITAALDFNGDGVVTASELETFVAPPPSELERQGSSSSSSLDPFSLRVQKLFRNAAAKGVSLEKLFSHLDTNGNGIFDSRELEGALLKTRAFDDLSEKDVRRILDTLDNNRDGNVTFDEFKNFVLYGVTDNLDGPGGRRGGGGPAADRTDSALKRRGDTRELLLRHLRRISEPDGGIAGLLAFLDRDEDGEIALPTFMKLLTREGVFDTMKEGDVLDWLAPAITNSSKREEESRNNHSRYGGSEEKSGESKGSNDRDRDRRDASEGKESSDGFSSSSSNVRVVPLMHMLDGNAPDGGLASEDTTGGRDAGAESARAYAEQEEIVLRSMPEYDFSNDPEIRALEKKLRGVGHALARKGLDVEGLFRKFDNAGHGAVRRTEFLEILSAMGLYILEKGKALEAAGAVGAAGGESIEGNMQSRQMARLKGSGASVDNSVRAARKYVMSSGQGGGGGDTNRGGSAGEFQDHLESMALINWYRQSQKHMLIQRVLAHSLAAVERIYPRFGKTLFFEHPISNPFAHEERFLIEFNDSELRLVTNLEEWMQLRQHCRPCVGRLGNEPIEGDMFDRDGHGRIQVSLLPQETLYIPFTFMTLVPYTPLSRDRDRDKQMVKAASRHGSRGMGRDGEAKDNAARATRGTPDDDNDNGNTAADEMGPSRSVEVRIISGTHGHVVANLMVEVCPLPCVVDRVFRFFEPENSVMKRRLRLIGCDDVKMFPGEAVMSSKYVHCVENSSSGNGGQQMQSDCRVVVEWGPSGAGAEEGGGSSSIGIGPAGLDIMLRYRCSNFPSSGDFYILLYNDPYQSHLHEVWHVVVQSRQRVDVNSSVGSTASVDLVIRGDRFARRARVFGSSTLDRAVFDPADTFQLVPQAYNRVLLKYSPSSMGSKRMHINMVDVDSRELISSWVLISSASAPDVLRQYEVQGLVGVPLTKKIVFQNPWDVPRRFVLTSSNDTIMRPRMPTLDIGPQGSEYLRLWFAGVHSGFVGTKEVFLFLNDESGHSEECFVFRVHGESR